MPPTARRFPQLVLLLALLLTIAGAGGLDASAKPGTGGGGGGTNQCSQGAWSGPARADTSNIPFTSQQECTQYLNGGGVPVALQSVPTATATVPPTPTVSPTSTPTATGEARTPIINTVSVAATSSSWTTVGSFPMGDTLTISASGTAAHYRDGNYGSDGFPATPTSCGITVGTVPYPCGALLGTFDPSDSGATFLIGSGTSHYTDNLGAYSVSATN